MGAVALEGLLACGELALHVALLLLERGRTRLERGVGRLAGERLGRSPNRRGFGVQRLHERSLERAEAGDLRLQLGQRGLARVALGLGALDVDDRDDGRRERLGRGNGGKRDERRREGEENLGHQN